MFKSSRGKIFFMEKPRGGFEALQKEGLNLNIAPYEAFYMEGL